MAENFRKAGLRAWVRKGKCNVDLTFRKVQCGKLNRGLRRKMRAQKDCFHTMTNYEHLKLDALDLS